MVVGTLVWRKRFSAAQYAAAGVMITGLVTVRAIVHANAAACGRTAAAAHQALAQLDAWVQFAWVGTVGALVSSRSSARGPCTANANANAV